MGSHVDPNKTRRHPVSAWVAVFSLALIVRLAYFLQIGDLIFVSHLVGDAATYDAWAKQIADGSWRWPESFYQAPLYPYFLASLYATLGHNLWLVRIIQAILGTVGCVMVGAAGAKFFSRQAGITTASMLALYGPAIYFDGILQKSSLGFFLMASLLLLVAIYGQQGHRWAVALAMGITLGLLSLTRENALAVTPVVAAWILWRTVSDTLPENDRHTVDDRHAVDDRQTVAWRDRAIHLALFAAGMILILSPVALHNYDRGGAFSVTTFQMGPNFYMGNHTGADGRYAPMIPGRETPEYERADATALAEQDMGRSLQPREVSDYWMRRAWADIRSDVWGWGKMLGMKWWLTWNRYEIPDTESYYIYRDGSGTLSALGRVWHFGVLCPMGVLGAIWAWPKRREVWVLYTLTIVMAVAVAAFYVFGRYRYPLVPIIAIFAGYAAVQTCRRAEAGALWGNTPSHRRYRQHPRHRRYWRYWQNWVAIGLAISSTIWVNWRVNPEQSLNAGQLGNLGAALATSGRIEESVPYFQQAADMLPKAPRLRQFLADALSMTGRYGEAIPHYQAVLELQPDRPLADFNLAVALEAVGRTNDALKHYQHALTLNPDDSESMSAIRRLTGNRSLKP